MKNNKISNKILAIVLSSMFVMTSVNFVDLLGYKGDSLIKAYAETTGEVANKDGETEKKDEEIKEITSDYELKNNISDIETNTGREVEFDFVGGTASIELTNYRKDSKNNGYLLIDIKKDYVKGYNNKYFSNKTGNKDYVDDAMRVTTNYTSEPTVIEKNFCSYSADDSDFVRFYVPYENANGKMTVTFTIPESVQKKIDESIKKSKENFDKYLEKALKDKKPDYQKISYKKADMIHENSMSTIIHSESIKSEDLLTRQTGELVYGGTNNNSPKSGFVNIETYGRGEEEKIYKGFIFDKEHKILRIKPEASGNKIRLYLGAGKNNGFNFDSRYDASFDIKYYNSGSTYRKVNDGKVHDKDDFEKNEYDRRSMSLGSGFNSVEIPINTNDGIIEIKLNGANNFLLNLKVENISDSSVSRPSGDNDSTSNTTVSEKIDSDAKRISGSDRYETAIKMSKETFSKSKVAVVASGQNFADALAGSSLAAANEAPLLLIDNKNSTIDDVNKELRRLEVEKVFVLGGKSAISVSTEMKLTNDKENSDERREVIRLSGTNRYETSYEIFKEVTRADGTKESPILVNGNNFADALSAGALSAKLKRGIVLTDGHNVNSKINKKSSDNIIIGGNASMDSSFGGKRISGSNRYATSVNVAEYFHNPKNVMLASGEKYPDGLASISLYKKYEGPLLLTPTNTLPKETKKYIKNNDIEDVYIIGGTNSVSSKIENMFK